LKTEEELSISVQGLEAGCLFGELVGVVETGWGNLDAVVLEISSAGVAIIAWDVSLLELLEAGELNQGDGGVFGFLVVGQVCDESADPLLGLLEGGGILVVGVGHVDLVVVGVGSVDNDNVVSDKWLWGWWLSIAGAVAANGHRLELGLGGDGHAGVDGDVTRHHNLGGFHANSWHF